jgi:hypothetical protein
MAHRKLSEILDDMRSAVINKDTEAAHAEADDLLIECLFKLADTFAPKTKESLEKLVELYGYVNKWYA